MRQEVGADPAQAGPPGDDRAWEKEKGGQAVVGGAMGGHRGLDHVGQEALGDVDAVESGAAGSRSSVQVRIVPAKRMQGAVAIHQTRAGVGKSAGHGPVPRPPLRPR